LSVLDPFAALYGSAVSLRLAAYRRGLLPVRRARRPVLSVGNVAAGGTGKTPFVRWLAGELLAHGQRPSILTRGYGRKSHGTVVVSDGAGAIASVRDSGDEASVLACALPTVPIVAAARRARAAHRAEEIQPGIVLHLLDDGFSHVALERGLDVVLLDAASPDAGGVLLPAGGLREPLSSLARADLIVVTKTEQADASRARDLAARYAPGVPVYHAATRVLGIRDPAGRAVAPGDLPGATLVAVAGLARPNSFFTTLAGLGIAPARSLAFPDHDPYGPSALGRIERTAEEAGATAVVTTEKDAVKLEGRLALPLFRVAVDMPVLEAGFFAEALTRLARRPS
jgi:tetraacyldisaccharide 4'-kinase